MEPVPAVTDHAEVLPVGKVVTDGSGDVVVLDRFLSHHGATVRAHPGVFQPHADADVAVAVATGVPRRIRMS
jgi:hypothetical protein